MTVWQLERQSQVGGHGRGNLEFIRYMSMPKKGAPTRNCQNATGEGCQAAHHLHPSLWCALKVKVTINIMEIILGHTKHRKGVFGVMCIVFLLILLSQHDKVVVVS